MPPEPPPLVVASLKIAPLVMTSHWNDEFYLRLRLSELLDIVSERRELRLDGFLRLYDLVNGRVSVAVAQATKDSRGHRFITRHTGVRFDLRYYSSLSRNENSPAFGPAQLRYWTGAVGVVLKY